MVSFVRKIAVAMVFLLGIGAATLIWFKFYNLSSVFVSVVITCIALFVTAIPKHDDGLCMSAMFLLFNVGMFFIMKVSDTNPVLGLLYLGYCLLLFVVLMLLAGVSNGNEITNWATFRQAVWYGKIIKPEISEV